MNRGFTLWFTGPPNSGKTTLSRMLVKHITEIGMPTEILDGDEVRRQLSPQLGFSSEDRRLHNARVAYICNLLNRHGVIALVAVIAPYQKIRDDLRKTISRYLEVYLECPLDVLTDRDEKNLYQRALQGNLPHFTGVSDPYETPTNPDLVLNTAVLSPDECCLKVVNYLRQRQLLESHQLD